MDTKPVPVDPEFPMEPDPATLHTETGIPLEAAIPAVPVAHIAIGNPKYPPISVRLDVLRNVSPKDLVEWAARIGFHVDTKEQAVTAILRYEYGDEQYNALKGVKEQ